MFENEQTCKSDIPKQQKKGVSERNLGKPPLANRDNSIPISTEN